MWTKAHRARHEARLKSIVSLRAVGQVAAWLEQADPPRSARATPIVAVVGAIAWHLRPFDRLRRRGMACAAPKLAALAHRVWLVPSLAQLGPVGGLAAPRGRAAPPCQGPQAGTTACGDRHPIRQVPPGARAARL